MLGFIAQKPLNPYEIKKIFEKLDMKVLFPMASSSIYATINALVKKRYIKGKKARQGNMPEKTIYSITKLGEEALRKTLFSSLAEAERIFSEFDIAISLVCYLDKDLALESLKNHCIAVEKEIAERRKQYNKHKGNGGIPYPGLARRMHNIYKREAEVKTIKVLVKEIENDQKWHHYPVLELEAMELERSAREEGLLKMIAKKAGNL
ncbi:MAG: PadR family transcriptional regulator [Desulfatiglandales bacterium]|nr:PadR family transcriptional regulator [Desulfatiglandales bacterium]